MLPSAYWKETLNIKFDTSFKAFYGNNVYQKIDDSQLKELLKNHPMFFLSSLFFHVVGSFKYVLIIPWLFYRALF